MKSEDVKYVVFWTTVVALVLGICLLLDRTPPAPQPVRLVVIPAPGQQSIQVELSTDAKALGKKLQGQLREVVVDGRIYTPTELDHAKVGQAWAEIRLNLRDGSQVLLFKPGKEVRHAAP